MGLDQRPGTGLGLGLGVGLGLGLNHVEPGLGLGLGLCIVIGLCPGRRALLDEPSRDERPGLGLDRRTVVK